MSRLTIAIYNTACRLDNWMGGADAVKAHLPIFGIQQMLNASISNLAKY